MTTSTAIIVLVMVIVAVGGFFLVQRSRQRSPGVYHGPQNNRPDDRQDL